jgi:Mg/Co/Ni transporter MgtE
MANQEEMDTLRERLDQILDEEQELLRAVELLGESHPADQADLIEQLEEGHRTRVLEALSHEHLAEVLE